MSTQNAPIFQAFKRGEQRRAIRKQNETPDQRLEREEFNQRCAENRLRDQLVLREKAKNRQLEVEQRRAKRLKCKEIRRRKARFENEYNIYSASENLDPQVKGTLKGEDGGQIAVSSPTEETNPTPSRIAERSKPTRPKKHKKYDQSVIKKILGHYCYLRRNERKKPLEATVVFAEQCSPPVYISKSTLFSWIQNPKYGVNTNTWILDENIAENVGSSRAGRPSLLDKETLQFVEDSLTAIWNDIGTRLSIPMAQSIIKNLVHQKNKGNLIGEGPGQLKISRTWTRTFLAERMGWRYKAVASDQMS